VTRFSAEAVLRNAVSPDAGDLTPYVVMFGVLALLIIACVVWVARGRTARRRDSRGGSSPGAQRRLR
jgi:hypothetical protein